MDLNTLSQYSNVNEMFGRDNPTVLIVLSVIIVLYYFVFSSLGTSSGVSSMSASQSSGLYFVEIIMWAMFIFLILINGLQYLFQIDIQTAIRNIFSPQPEIDITITQEKDKETPVPEITIEKQVFNVPDNKYTYQDAKALCSAYGSRLATYEEIESAYNDGAEWCNYGWSDKQQVLFPTQKTTFDKLQKIKGHENDCGRIGINGGFIGNPNARFGVNCYGYKPEITPEEQLLMSDKPYYPKTNKEKRFEEKVKQYRKKLPEILISSFNRNRWSQI